MTPEEDGERLIRVEERLKNTGKELTKLNNNIEKFMNTFVPRSEMDLELKYRDKEIQDINDNLHDMDQNKWSIRRLWPAWVAVAISLFS